MLEGLIRRSLFDSFHLGFPDFLGSDGLACFFLSLPEHSDDVGDFGCSPLLVLPRQLLVVKLIERYVLLLFGSPFMTAAFGTLHYLHRLRRVARVVLPLHAIGVERDLIVILKESFESFISFGSGRS